jgi:phage tail sheath protein FI
MAYLDSPGIAIKEVDKSSYVGGNSSTTGGYAGAFGWGPVLVPTIISNQTDLIRTFGGPVTGYNQQDFYSVAYFLKYSNACYVTRVTGPDAKNAVAMKDNSTTVGKEVVINSSQAFETTFTNSTSVDFAARYPGSLGNGIEIIIIDSISFTSSKYKNLFTGAPTGTELHVLLLKNGSVLEKYEYLNALPGTKKSDGTVAYYVEVINTQSNYIYVLKETGACDCILSGGTLGATFATYKISSVTYAASIYPGIGNNTVIYLVDSANYAALSTDVKSHLVGAPAVDQCAVVVYTNGFFTEVFEALDKLSTSANYYVTQFNAQSSTAHLMSPVDFTVAAQTVMTLTGAVGDVPVGDSVVNGYNIMADADTYDISLMFAGSNTTVCQTAVVSIAESRKFTVGFVSPQFSSCKLGGSAALTAVLADRQAIYSSSYGFMDSNWGKVYDPINKNSFWMAMNPVSAGLQAQVENQREAWYVGMGTTYGRISGIQALAWEQSQVIRDALYKSQINPLCTFKNEGILLFGSKTLQVKPSAFDRLNVRRLFIVIEKAVGKTARALIGELNTDQTQRSVVNSITPFMRDIKAKQGCYDFAIVCDATNNTPQVINTNGIAIGLYIKPTKNIDFVYVDMVAVSSGVSFQEIIGK